MHNRRGARTFAGLAVCAVGAAVLLLGNTARRRLGDASVDEVTGHKRLAPTDATDVAGFVCAALGLVIAAGGGIGGGGMLVPIYVLVMGFKPKFAIPLSNMTVLGGAIANVAMNARKRHPLADRALVDWDLLVLMEPLTLAGALAGARWAERARRDPSHREPGHGARAEVGAEYVSRDENVRVSAVLVP